nr:hypothetical protein [Streptosporangium amethystogenes]
MTCMVSSESPPRSKKLSCTPILAASTPSTSAQIPASSRSAASRGATRSAPAPPSGAGSARRSVFPLDVSGSSSSRTKKAGTR